MQPFVQRFITLDVPMMEHLVQPVEDYRAPVFLFDGITGPDGKDTAVRVTYNMQSGEIIVQHPDYDHPFITLYASQMPQYALQYLTIDSIIEWAIRHAQHAEVGGENEYGDIDLIKGSHVQLSWDADLHLMPVFIGCGYRSWYDHDAQVLVDTQDEPSF